MIKRAIKLKEVVDVFYISSTAKKDGLVYTDILIAVDWLILKEVKAVLKLFVVVTKTFEGNKPQLYSVVAAMYILINGLR
jgi:hypothetical protein